MISRRTFAAGGIASLTVATRAWAAPADVADRRLTNRLDLWHEYASRTENLLVRVATTRETSLMQEPIVGTGSLLFVAPATVVLRDDAANGSTTVIDASGTRMFANRTDLRHPAPTPAGARPAADWLAARMVRIFAPVPAEQLIEGCRAVVPKGAGYKIDILPPRGSGIRRVIRSFSVTMDPAVGAVTRIAIAEAQGDRVTLGLSDHRQNLAARDLTAITDPLAALGITLPIGS